MKKLKKLAIISLMVFLGIGIVMNSTMYSNKTDEAYQSLKEKYQLSSVNIDNTKEEEQPIESGTEDKVENNSTEEPTQVVDNRTNEQKVWDALKSAGYNPGQAAGIIGNLYQESGINPSRCEKGFPFEGRGIAQWSFGRRQALMSFATQKGTAWDNLDTQIEYLIKELKSKKYFYEPYKSQFEKTTSVEEAVECFCYGFERPNKLKANLTNRNNKAWEAYYRNVNR